LAEFLYTREEPIAGQNRGSSHSQEALSLGHLDELQALALFHQLGVDIVLIPKLVGHRVRA
jgi:hypothetical protein